MAHELNNDNNYMPLYWAGLDETFGTADDLFTPVLDEDWYVDLNDGSAPQAANGTVYSYNRTLGTPLAYDLTAEDVLAKKDSRFGWLTYNTNGVSVGAFTIKVPMVVYYKWGKLETTVTIQVADTI